MAGRTPGVFLTDFGLAKDCTTGSRLTRTGTTLGTPAYMSPEQARGELSMLGPATDTWALGCVAYELLAGRAAFEAESPAAVIGRVLRDQPRMPDATPGPVRRLLCTALQKPAQRRWPTAAALREACERVAAGRSPGGPTSRRFAVVLVAGGALALALGFGLTGFRGSTPPPAPTPPVTAPSPGAAIAAEAHASRLADPERALQLWVRALNADPRRHDWRIELGLLQWALADVQAARASWDAVPDGVPDAPLARLYRGLELYFSLRGHEARQWLEPVRDAPAPVGPLARATLATLNEDWVAARRDVAGLAGWDADLVRAYMERHDPAGDRRAALQAYDRAFAEGRIYLWMWLERANARRDVGDLAGALADYDIATERMPDDPTGFNNRATVKELLGDPEGALKDYAHAIRLDPTLRPAFENRAKLRRERGEHQLALADCDAAVALAPTRPETHYERGLTLQVMGQLGAAIASYTRVLELDPRHAAALAHRGAAHGARGEPMAAARDLEAALAIDPRQHVALANRGVLRQQRGDLDGAVADFRSAMEAGPPEWPQRAALASMLARAEALADGR